MDNDTPKKNGTITEKRYLVFGRPAGHLFYCLVLILYYLYCMLIPILYALSTHFPAEEDIHYTEGLFTYRDKGRQYYQIGVVTGNKANYFSCRSDFMSVEICEVDRKYYKQLEHDLEKNNKPTNVALKPKLYQQWQGKPARIGWFRQRYNIFYTDKRVVQVIIDGKEVVSNNNVIKHMNWKKNTWLIDIIFSSPVLIITLLFTRQIILNKDIENGK